MDHARLEELLPKLTAAQPFQYVLNHGNASAVIYAPRGEDQQYAHEQAEVYVVARGRGRFLNGPRTIDFGAGDLLFVDIGMQHRFINFTSDLVVWAVFFGPSILGDHAFTARAADVPEHSGALTIKQTQGENIFRATWNVVNEAPVTGLGFAHEGHMSFARTRSEKIGLVEYRMDGGGLRARWAHTDFGGQIGLGEGVAQGQASGGFVGRYTIQYQDSAGSPIFVPFTLEITEDGPVRRLKWDSDAMKFEGSGIETDGVLVAAWGTPALDLELADYASPLPGARKMTGRTLRSGSSIVGSEDVVLATP